MPNLQAVDAHHEIIFVNQETLILNLSLLDIKVKFSIQNKYFISKMMVILLLFFILYSFLCVMFVTYSNYKICLEIIKDNRIRIIFF